MNTATLAAPWWNPFALVSQRLRAWWHARLPVSDTITLTQRNVYILPTPAGWMLAATLLVLLIASINYQLNLGYLLTFLLAGSVAVGMHVCHNNLRGITMNLVAPNAVFMPASSVFDIKISHTRKTTRYGIGLSLLQGGTHWSWTDVPAQGSSIVQVAFKPPRRGLQRIPLLTAETRFPLGSFRVWTVWRPASEVLVYPAPESYPPPLPPGEPRAGGAAAARVSSTGEFDGVRAYRRGDPLKLVVWKKAATAMTTGSDELVSRDASQAQRYELWLDFAQCGSASTEARLSRLCAWVLAADKQGLSYGLRLAGKEIKPAMGEAHKRLCLEALALF
jgi:uncharacterized protein (DUF58 family)